MRSRSHKQFTSLRPDDHPEPALVNSFKTSVKLARAFSLERKSQANGQTAYLHKKEQQLAYVDAARSRALPPLGSVVVRQGLVAELRRDCTDVVLPAIEDPASKKKRLARQEAFLAGRKARHDAAVGLFEREMDALSEEREARTQQALERMRKSVEEADAKVCELLYEMEVDTEQLGAKTEEGVKEIAKGLSGIGDWRRENIDGFTVELDGVDKDCQVETAKMVRIMVEQLTAAAHVLPGEVERIVEEKALQINAVHLENQKSVKTLAAKLHVQALEEIKAGKARYHRGVLRWKQKRHQHSMEVARTRIASQEFRQPQKLEELMEQVRDQQQRAFRQREDLCTEFFSTPLSRINTACTKVWEERNNALNDEVEQVLDALLKELKEFKDELDISAEDMLKALCRDLEILDAREEWGTFEDTAGLVDAELRPSMQECLDLVQGMLVQASEELTRQDEAQHHVMCSFVAFFRELGLKQEDLQRTMENFETTYRHEVEDCEDADEERVNEQEGMLQKYHTEMDEEVHHDALDKLKEVAFEHLDAMAQGYRDHCDTLLEIHQRYPSGVKDLFQAQTEGFCSLLGLVTDEKLKEEAAAEAAAAADAASAAAEAAAAAKKPAKGKETQPEEAPPEPPPEKPPPPEFMSGAGSGCTVYEKLLAYDFRRMVLESPPWAPAEGHPETEEDPNQAGAARELPTLSDGTEALVVLEFRAPWIEEQLATARETVFAQLGMCRKHLDRVDTPALCKAVRQELDQRLRRHTNRKGEVQVEWYMPRYNTISKHKDKFERHLIDAAKRNQAHDDRAKALSEEFEAAEATYREAIAGLKAKVPEETAMAFLTKCDRQAREQAELFLEKGRKAVEELALLATEAPQRLQREGQALLKACSTGAEGYSQKELAFYGAELEELGGALDKRAEERAERARQMESEFDAKRAGPLDEFKAVFDEAVGAMKAARKRAKEAKAAEEAKQAEDVPAAATLPPKKGK